MFIQITVPSNKNVQVNLIIQVQVIQQMKGPVNPKLSDTMIWY